MSGDRKWMFVRERPVASLVDQTGLIWLGRNYPSFSEHKALVVELHHRADNAVLIPNSSMPSIASIAPIARQCCSSISPEAPRVLIESKE